MKTVGITGNIGCGKSFICSYFEQIGIPVFHSDPEARELYHLPEIIQTFRQQFGSAFYNADNSLNKEFVSNLIFNDSEAALFIESVLYPALHKRFGQWCVLHTDKPYVLYESAIIFEKGIANRFDKTILVTASEETRIRRVMLRDRCTCEAVLQRIRTQWPEEKKRQLADFIIEHDKDIMPEERIKEVDRALRS